MPASAVTPTLTELAATANAEHGLAIGAVTKAVEHAIRAGDALIAARRQVPRLQWTQWCEANVDIGSATIFRYIRLATYADQLPKREPLGIDAAYELLRGLPHLSTVYGVHNLTDIPEDVLEEVRRLRAEGVAWMAAAQVVGFPYVVVRRRLDPAFARQQKSYTNSHSRKKREAARALAREQRDAAVKKIGGNAANAYALIRRAAVELDRSFETAQPHERGPLRDALAYVHKAEDEIVKALRVGRSIGRPHKPRPA